MGRKKQTKKRLSTVNVSQLAVRSSSDSKMVKEKGLHQPKAQGQKEARNEKAAYNKAHRDGKKEGTSRYVNEKLWLVRMDSES